MDILNIAIPALIVFLTAFLLLDKMFKNEEKRRVFELRKNNASTILPRRLQAYERLTLFLERITPANLVMSTIKPNMNLLELQTKLIDVIRAEYAHNVTQQIYVSENVWTSVRAAKESMIQLINVSASKCEPEQSANHLAEVILKVYASSEQTPVDIALKTIKDEIQKYF